MSIVDDILGFIWSVQGRTPDQLYGLEKQAIAVAGAATLNRFAPTFSQGLFYNWRTRAVAKWIARHPLATASGYFIAAYSNSTTRGQWLGAYTREIETAAIAVIGGGSIPFLRKRARYLKFVFERGVAIRARLGLRYLSKLNPVKLPGTLIFNRRSLNFAKFLAKHPAAILASYLTANYIDQTYRYQFLGYRGKELIALGLLPVYASAPWVIPKVVRCAGNAAYYGSRGLASGLEWFLRTPTPAPVAPTATRSGLQTSAAAIRNGVASRGGLGVLAAAGLEAFNYIVRRNAEAKEVSPPWYAAIPGTGAATAGLASLIPAAGRFLASRVALAGYTPELAYRQWRWFISKRWVKPFPKIANAITATSWAAGISVLTISSLKPFLGLEAISWFSLGVAGTATKLGYISPLFRTGRLHGVYKQAKGLAGSVLKGFAFIGRDLPASTVKLASRIRWHALLAASPEARILSRFLPLLPTAALRALTSWPTAIGFGAREGLNEFAEIQGMSPEIRDLGRRNRVFRAADLTSMTNRLGRARAIYELQEVRASLGYSLPQSDLNAIAWGTLSDQRLAVILQETQSMLAAFNQQLESSFSTLGIIAQTSALALSTIAQGVEDFLTPSIPHDAHVDDYIWATMRQIGGGAYIPYRDARGRFSRPAFEFNTGQPGPPTGMEQALAYINKLARAAKLSIVQNGGSGVHSQQHHGAQRHAASGREFWLFRGRDRNLLLQTLRDLLLIVERDKLAASGKTTTKISTREPVLPASVPGLAGSIIVLIRALEYDVSLVRDRGKPGSYYSIDIESQANAG